MVTLVHNDENFAASCQLTNGFAQTDNYAGIQFKEFLKSIQPNNHYLFVHDTVIHLAYNGDVLKSSAVVSQFGLSTKQKMLR